MGLSGRKIKQRIPQDPRNLSWADGNVEALSVPPGFITQPPEYRCIPVWFYISIQAGLRSYRQKCHPRDLRCGSHPTSQGTVHSFLCEWSPIPVLHRCTTNLTCSVSGRNTRRILMGSHGSKIETLKTYSRGSMPTRKILQRIKQMLPALMASSLPVSTTLSPTQLLSDRKRREEMRKGRGRRRKDARKKNDCVMMVKLQK